MTRFVGTTDAGGKAETPERFDDILDRLRKLVDRLESGNLSLEDGLRCFEDGMDLCRKGASILRWCRFTIAGWFGMLRWQNGLFSAGQNALSTYRLLVTPSGIIP